MSINLKFGPDDEDIESLVSSGKERRRQEIIRLYFVQRHTLQEVGTILGVSKSQIHREAEEIRAELLAGLKNDLRANKEVLGHLVELMTQVDCQTATIWAKIAELDKHEEQLRQTESGVSFNAPDRVTDTVKKLLPIHDRRIRYYNMVRQQTLAMLSIFDMFGLTGKDALEVILSGGVDIDASIQQVKQTIMKLIEIVRVEVTDAQARESIFRRLANEIKLDTKKDEEEGYDATQI